MNAYTDPKSRNPIDNTEWIDKFIHVLEEAVAGRLPIKIDNGTGQAILVEIRQDILDLIKDNRVRLIGIGQRIFKEFLYLWSRQQEYEALVLIYEQLDNSDLIDKYKEDTIKLAEIAQQTQADRDFWMAFGQQVGSRIVLGALWALL